VKFVDLADITINNKQLQAWGLAKSHDTRTKWGDRKDKKAVWAWVTLPLPGL